MFLFFFFFDFSFVVRWSAHTLQEYSQLITQFNVTYGDWEHEQPQVEVNLTVWQSPLWAQVVATRVGQGTAECIRHCENEKKFSLSVAQIHSPPVLGLKIGLVSDVIDRTAHDSCAPVIGCIFLLFFYFFFDSQNS